MRPPHKYARGYDDNYDVLVIISGRFPDAITVYHNLTINIYTCSYVHLFYTVDDRTPYGNNTHNTLYEQPPVE
jgi:hypothetical protein